MLSFPNKSNFTKKFGSKTSINKTEFNPSQGGNNAQIAVQRSRRFPAMRTFPCWRRSDLFCRAWGGGGGGGAASQGLGMDAATPLPANEPGPSGNLSRSVQTNFYTDIKDV